MLYYSHNMLCMMYDITMPSVHWQCWLGGRPGILSPVKMYVH